MTNPCELGMKCPFHGFDEDGDGACFYPYMVGRDTVGEDEYFSLDYEADCQLIDYDSVFYYLINAYGDANQKVLEGVKEFKIKWDKICQEIYAKIQERKDARAIYDKAYQNDPKAVIELREVYHNTDMPDEEYMAHLKIIAEGKE